jgi:uncharacterized protein YndB with AHSA1/START domain
MPRKFELRKEIEVDASPEQVWQAIATGPGITSWFAPHEVEPREGGTVRLTLGEWTSESTITTWDPPRRFAVRGQPAEDGSVQAFEFLVEGREGGSTVLRFVHSFLGDNWEGEYEAFGRGWDMYLHTLAQYLTHFAGRAPTFVTAAGPPVPSQESAWATLLSGLGLAAEVTQGERVRLTPEGLAPVEGVIDYLDPPAFLGLRTSDGLYRFHVRPDAVAVGHHLFAGEVEHKQADRAWQVWLTELFARAG